jgi:chromosome segregation ATPase
MVIMGTRHWPEDADEAVEALNRRIAKLESNLRGADITVKKMELALNASLDRVAELEKENKLLREKLDILTVTPELFKAITGGQ